MSPSMFSKKPLQLMRPAAVASSCLAALIASAAAPQSIPEDSAAVPPETAPSQTEAGAAAPRPRMGLMIPLTPPRGQPTAKTTAKTAAKGAVSHSLYQNTKATEKAQHYYAEVWGVDKLHANYTSSGNLIKFSYRVLQPKLAKALGDHENNPELIGIRSNAVLHIPTMEKIGQLRQMSAAEANKQYWMVFSNKGSLVKPGDEVSVIIGRFRADGLIVE